MIIYQVEPKHVDIIWPYVEELLSKPLEKSLGENTLEDIKSWIKSKTYQLWVILDKEQNKIIGACTTQIIHYSRKNHLRMELAATNNNTMDLWIDDLYKATEDFSKNHNIDHVEIVAQRDGWIRLLKDRGYRKYYTVLVKDMKDD